MDIFEKLFAEGKSRPGHHITLTDAPSDRGSWPLATCSCGWHSTNKDIDVVQDAIDAHVDWNMK